MKILLTSRNPHGYLFINELSLSFIEAILDEFYQLTKKNVNIFIININKSILKD
jgi:hypothetical protein